MDPTTRKRLVAAAEEGIATDLERRMTIAGMKPQPGAIMLVNDTDPTFFWVGLTWHRDAPEMLFCVPADEFPLAGSPDIAVDKKLASFEMTLRCGHALWFTPPLLERVEVVAKVDATVLEEALDLVAQLIDGTVISTDVDEIAELDAWYGRLDVATRQIERLRKDLEDSQASAGDAHVVTRLPAPELAWAASGVTTEWPTLEFAGPLGRTFALEGGLSDSALGRTTFTCAQLAGPRYPVVAMKLALRLIDGRLLRPVEASAHDGDVVTFESLGGFERVDAIVVEAFQEEP